MSDALGSLEQARDVSQPPFHRLQFHSDRFTAEPHKILHISNIFFTSPVQIGLEQMEIFLCLK